MIKKRLFTFFLSVLVYELNAQTPELWGMTQAGGPLADGAIFKIDGDGSGFDTTHTFRPTIPGMYPLGNLVQASDGLIYGVTEEGGSKFQTEGVIFSCNPKTGEYKIAYQFNNVQITGAYPSGGLIRANDGKLYGMAGGGVNNAGVIYRFNPKTSNYKKLYDFNGVKEIGPENGLVQSKDGNLYGATFTGGQYGVGMIFRINPITGLFNKLHDFDTLGGEYPTGNLIQANDGRFYGVTYQGGINNDGVLFRYSADSNKFTVLFNFDYLAANPSGSLLQATNGLLYGVTNWGNGNGGVLYSYSITSDSLKRLADFHDDLKHPHAGLIQAQDGLLYGTTAQDWINEGTIYSFNTKTNQLTDIYAFQGPTGALPYASLLEATNENLYGSTEVGGNYNMGVLFQFNPKIKNYKRLVTFGESDGARPVANLLYINGLLYGSTPYGGTVNQGVIFSTNPTNNNYKVLYTFQPKTGGFSPSSSLVRASNHKLYGTTDMGGKYSSGVIFSFDPDSMVYKKIFDFSQHYHTNKTLCVANNDLLYGSGDNYIFSFDPKTDSFVILINYINRTSVLIQGIDGLLYGLMPYYGKNGHGNIFSFNTITNEINDVYDFDSISGGDPQGSLMQAYNGILYGMNLGGKYGDGVLYSFDPVIRQFNKLLDFHDSIGSYPVGEVIEGSNGVLFGMTNEGGKYGAGVIFSFDPQNKVYTKLKDLNGQAAYPYGDLVDITKIVTTVNNFTSEALNCNIFSSENIVHVKMNLPSIKSNVSINILNNIGETIFTEDEGLQNNLFEKDIALRKPILPGIYVVTAKCGNRQFTKQILLSAF